MLLQLRIHLSLWTLVKWRARYYCLWINVGGMQVISDKPWLAARVILFPMPSSGRRNFGQRSSFMRRPGRVTSHSVGRRGAWRKLKDGWSTPPRHTAARHTACQAATRYTGSLGCHTLHCSGGWLVVVIKSIPVTDWHRTEPILDIDTGRCEALYLVGHLLNNQQSSVDEILNNVVNMKVRLVRLM